MEGKANSLTGARRLSCNLAKQVLGEQANPKMGREQAGMTASSEIDGGTLRAASCTQ